MRRDLLPKLRPLFERHLCKKVTFRGFSRNDAFPFFAATRNPEFNRHLLWHAPETEEEMVVRVEKMMREMTLGEAMFISICEKETGGWIGAMAFKPFQDGLEFSLYLHPLVWSKGVVFTAGRAALQIVMDAFPEVPLYVRTKPENERMVRICEYYRFEKVGHMDLIHASGGAVPVDIYRLCKEQWQPERAVREY